MISLPRSFCAFVRPDDIAARSRLAFARLAPVLADPVGVLLLRSQHQYGNWRVALGGVAQLVQAIRDSHHRAPVERRFSAETVHQRPRLEHAGVTLGAMQFAKLVVRGRKCMDGPGADSCARSACVVGSAEPLSDGPSLMAPAREPAPVRRRRGARIPMGHPRLHPVSCARGRPHPRYGNPRLSRRRSRTG